MKKIYLCLIWALALCACQDKDSEQESMKLDAIDENVIESELQGDDLVWTWPENTGLDMQVVVYANDTKFSSEIVNGNTYTQKLVDTNIKYTYVFKLTDGSNFSQGVVKEYLRPGATKIASVQLSQVEKAGGYDAKVEWTVSKDAESVLLTATNGERNIREVLNASISEYIIPDVLFNEEWTVTVIAQNAQGNSLSTSSALKIGKTAIGFLSAYETPELLLQTGDDDEASAWLWFNSEYPNGQYIYMGDITSMDIVEPYRVLFWIRDLENVGEDAVWNMPQVALDALEPIKQWYKEGGNLLLWSHAIPYLTNLGRIDGDMLKNNDRTIGTGFGGWNPDTWSMAVQLHPGSKFKKDFSSHPIYKGLDVVENDRTKLIAFKGPGFTEDHNCLFFNAPAILTGIGNQEEACYNQLTSVYGIYPLGTWDSQIDWVSQLNVWEAQQGNTEFKGTTLCIGNGGCEFSMKNEDGTPDISAYPKNNIYQDNVLKLAKNCLEYLKTR